MAKEKALKEKEEEFSLRKTEPITKVDVNYKGKDFHSLAEINDSMESFEDVLNRMNPKTLEVYLENIIETQILEPALLRASHISKGELEKLLNKRKPSLQVDEKKFQAIKAYVKEEAEKNLSSLSRVRNFLAEEVRL